MNIDAKQQNHIKLLFIGLASLGGIVALITYIDTRKHRKIAESNALLENQIKVLQLEQLKYNNHKINKAA